MVYFKEIDLIEIYEITNLFFNYFLLWFIKSIFVFLYSFLNELNASFLKSDPIITFTISFLYKK